MTNQTMRRLGTVAAVLGLAACAGGPAADSAGGTDEGARVTEALGVVPPAPLSVLDRFAPRPSNDRSVDYALVDEALDLIVFNAGPSLRERARRPDPLVGSRQIKGHQSPYRLEGNKVFFSQFDDDVKASLSEYRRSLEAIAGSGAVQQLPRNEQLAFWYNLHNLVVIDEIAKAYPTRRPSRLRPGDDGALFHDADIVDLGDAAISLRDVRQIVYTHWSDPKVMYGFYWGDLAGPSIRSEAYKGSDVSADLDRQAKEFVNSLRGVRDGGGEVWVSPIYAEARPFFFPAWPTDFKTHLLAFANEDVEPVVAQATDVRYGQYQESVADLSGGDVTSDLGFGGSFAPRGSRAALEENFVDRDRVGPQSMGRMIREYEDKILKLQKRGYLRPRVIIIDVPTDDPDDEVR